jgi:hypothetical protein
MTASVVYHSIYGNRFGIQGVPGSATLSLDSFPVATTPNGGLTYTSVSSAAITALAGGTLTASTPVLNKNTNIVGTVATTSDSVQLPPSSPGLEVILLQEGAATAAVFPAIGTTDIINALTTGTSLPVGTSKMVVFSCVLPGKWRSATTATS